MSAAFPRHGAGGEQPPAQRLDHTQRRDSGRRVNDLRSWAKSAATASICDAGGNTLPHGRTASSRLCEANAGMGLSDVAGREKDPDPTAP